MKTEDCSLFRSMHTITENLASFELGEVNFCQTFLVQKFWQVTQHYYILTTNFIISIGFCRMNEQPCRMYPLSGQCALMCLLYHFTLLKAQLKKECCHSMDLKTKKANCNTYVQTDWDNLCLICTSISDHLNNKRKLITQNKLNFSIRFWSIAPRYAIKTDTTNDVMTNMKWEH